MQKVLIRAQSATAPAISAAGTASQPSAAKSGPRKLLTDTFELRLEDAGQQLSDATDFTVIGVLGGQGVGKSTIMSLLAGAPWSSDTSGGGAGLHEPPFAPQPPEAAFSATHHTVGIDMFVSPERLLLLDTQALLSPSVLLELQRRETSLPADVQTHENLLELQSLRLATLLLSVCHLVVCVHDVQLDPLSLRTLRVAQMLRHRLPDISHLALASPAAVAAITASAAAVSADVDCSPVVEYSPRLAFVFNRMPSSAFAPTQQATLHAVLQRLFPRPERLAGLDHGGGNGNGGGGMAAGITGNDGGSGSGAGAGSGGGDAEGQSDENLSLLVLPENDGGVASVCGSHRGFRPAAEAVRDVLLSVRRLPFGKSVSEREWLRGVGRMWELIRRSLLLADYNRALQKLHCFA